MTTINDISDLVQVLKDRPDWLAAVRNMIVGEELLSLPQQLAQFIKATEENFRLVNRRFNRLEGKVGNLEGSDYERRVRTRIMVRMEHNFGMKPPFIAMHQEGQISPEINRLYARGLQSDVVTLAELEDLQETDIIICDADNRHAVIEVSVTADHDDMERASRRAYTLTALSGAPVQAAVATTHLPEQQQSLAEAQGVTVFIIPNRH